MRVGFDLDGVLYNFGDSVKRTLDYLGQGDIWKSGPNPNPYWDFYKDWGWTGQQFVELCNKGADAGIIFCGPTRPGAVEAVNKVADAGHEVIIITDRAFGSDPSVSHNNTKEWLLQHGFWYDELVFSADKTVVWTDTFIDDKLENYDNLRRAGTEAFLLNRPWNDVPKDYRNRINTLDEYTNYVLSRRV